MSNHEIFMLPGQFLFRLILSILNVDAASVTPESTLVFVFIIALFFWWKMVMGIIALVKKQFGFYPPRGGHQ